MEHQVVTDEASCTENLLFLRYSRTPERHVESRVASRGLCRRFVRVACFGHALFLPLVCCLSLRRKLREKMNPMPENPEFNVHFLGLVEKYPVLYNFHLAEHSNRSAVEKAWHEVAKKVNFSCM